MLTRPVVLAAFSARSQAYLQSLAAAGVADLTVVAYGAPVAAPSVDHSRMTNQATRQWCGIALPDLSEPIERTCARAGWQLLHCVDGDLNSPALLTALVDCAPSLVIFSGYGGQIVGNDLLAIGAPFLHAHAGMLPDYRGSTTTYYSALEQRVCAASALFLRAGIDTGPVIAQRTYPLPPRGMDVDRLYDAAIRANILVKALHAIANDGPAAAAEQDSHGGHTYYVIHPVLKHLALLSMPASDASGTMAPKDVTTHAA